MEQQKQQEDRLVSLWVMGGFGILVGIVAGYGAVIFRALISLVQNVLFYGQFSLTYDSNILTPPSPWGPS